MLQAGILAGSVLGAGTLLGGRAAAAVPSSPYFDLTQPSYDLFRSKALQDETVMQSFTFDNVNRRLFVAQLKNGSTSDANGDLCITQLDFDGNQLGYIYLTGFGHGMSIGVQPVGTASYLWTEVDSVNERGTRIARFKFVNGATVDRTSASLSKFTPVSGDTMTCAVDPVNNRLAVRYNSGGMRIAVYDLAAAAAGNFSTMLAQINQPSGLGTFQGYTIYGEYLYILESDSYEHANNDGIPEGNSRLTSVHLNTGTVNQSRVLTKAGSTLEPREPEGLGIYRTIGGETRLFLGFASGSAGARKANIFYKNALV